MIMVGNKNTLANVAGRSHVHAKLIGKSGISKLPSIGKPGQSAFQNDGLRTIDYAAAISPEVKKHKHQENPSDYGPLGGSLDLVKKGVRHRNDQGAFRTVQPGDSEFESVKNSRFQNSSTHNQLEFSQNLSRVIASVQNRKNMPRLKSLFNYDRNSQSLNTQEAPAKSISSNTQAAIT